ncbi:MAG TPA: glycosyltransferase family 4 protein [Puia sp.]|nr:glycosyltransferase family 4 protein [Puia sp.]
MESTTKALVILTPGFPKDEEDSTCLPSQQLFIKSLHNNFPSLKIFILSFEYPFTRSSYRWNNNQVFPFNGWKKKKSGKLKLWLSIWNKMSQLKKENEVIGILSFWCAECAFIGHYFGRIHRIRHLSWILGQDARKDNRYIRWMRPAADELIAMSDFLADEFHKNHSVRPAFVIPNGVDISMYSSSNGTRDIDVLGVGSLIELKQYDLFIRLIHELKKSIPTIRARIYGKGPEENNLQAMIETLEMEDTIQLEGERPHAEILELMQRSRVLLHTSSYEGFSTVCLEALYAGCRVISFCHPMKQWIRHWYIAKNNEEVVELLREILDDPDSDYRPVLPYSMDMSANSVMKLFGCKNNIR